MFQNSASNLFLELSDTSKKTRLELFARHWENKSYRMMRTFLRQDIEKLSFRLAYIPGVATAILKCAMDGNGIVAKFSSRRSTLDNATNSECRHILWRLWWPLWYRACCIKQYGRCTPATEKKYGCWCVTVLRFFHIKNVYTHKALRVASGKTFSEKEIRDRYCEICFVKWYEILNKEIFPIHNFDRVFSCMRLRWEQNPEKPHALSAGREFGLVPQGSIRYPVGVVPKDKGLDIIDNQICQKVHARKPNESDFG